MPDRSDPSPPEPRWGPASTHRASSRPTPASRPSARANVATPSKSSWPASSPARSATGQRTNPWATRRDDSPEQSDRAGALDDDGGDVLASSPSTSPWDRPGTARTVPPRRSLPRPRWSRRTLLLVPLLILVLLIGYPMALAHQAMSNMHRVAALPADSQGTGASGRNFLVVGSDSRAGTKLDKVIGARADTIMLLHVPLRGTSVLVSIPRDSYVEIPGHGKNKINAAYALGGPKLLVETVEKLTTIRIDDYVETGLGGFGKVVDAVGGVRLCPKFDMNDKDAHINLKKGCQQMNGATALGYARARHSDPEGDLGRVKRQREVLTAIVKKAANPSTILNPFSAFPLAKAGGQALTVDDSTGQWAIYRFLMGMRSVSGKNGISMTVPVSNPGLRTAHGSAVELDATSAPKLFKAIRDGDTDTVRSLT